MKSNILLTSMAALLVTTAANATTIKPFVGATFGIQGALYSDDAKDASKAQHYDLPEDFIAFGLEGGVRFGEYNKIYNSGVTFAAKTSTRSEVEHKFTDDTLARINYSEIYGTYDNYIRLSGDKIKRIDLVLGIGAGAMNYHINDAGSHETETIWSFTPAFKIGVDFEINKHITLSAETLIFTPSRDDYLIDGSYVTGGAFKYVF